MTSFAFYSTLVFFIVLCVLFILLILVQKGRGGGISSAFGGAGGNTAFGSKTGDVLTWATSVVFGIFLVLCVSLSLLATRLDREQTGKLVAAPETSTQTDLPAVPSEPTTAPAPQPSLPPGSIPDAALPGPVAGDPATRPG